jgi:hypothetical protein
MIEKETPIAEYNRSVLKNHDGVQLGAATRAPRLNKTLSGVLLQ